jgi:hypothetical protein
LSLTVLTASISLREHFSTKIPIPWRNDMWSETLIEINAKSRIGEEWNDRRSKWKAKGRAFSWNCMKPVLYYYIHKCKSFHLKNAKFCLYETKILVQYWWSHSQLF